MARARRTVRAFVAGLAAALAVACGVGAEDDTGAERTAEDEVAETLADQNAPLLVKDPRTLVALEQRGFALSRVLGVDDATDSSTSTEALLASKAYASIVNTVQFDLDMLRRQDPRSGVGVDFPHRQFDPTWLKSRQARFELVAVVNRLDRKHVGDGCGELRLVYRLAYTAPRSESRLPMTINVVIPQRDDGNGCRTVAKRWLDARSGSPAALLAGPLKDPAPVQQYEINFQAVRWPSNERREMGGHADYILRVFQPTEDGARMAPLENTPRTDLSAEEREELRGWIREHLDEIDDGTVVPEKSLATQARSVGPRGLARMANRAYAQLFADAEAAFGDLPLAETKQLKSGRPCHLVGSQVASPTGCAARTAPTTRSVRSRARRSAASSPPPRASRSASAITDRSRSASPRRTR